MAMKSVQAAYTRNYTFSRTEQFVPWMRKYLRTHPVRVLRIHSSGDFYDEEYVQKWYSIAKACPEVVFYSYTRSWRDLMLADLIALGRLPNVCLWWSFDRETGSPPMIAGIRRAYMAVDDLDASRAPDDADLVFRVRRRTPMKKANGVLVCPAENGIQGKFKHTCTTCGLCWNKQRWPSQASLFFEQLGIDILAEENEEETQVC